MEFLLSAKQEGDIFSWRGTTDFFNLFREKLIGPLEGCSSYQALQQLEQVHASLGEIQRTTAMGLENLNALEESLLTVTEFDQLHKITKQFYSGVYGHVAIFRSPIAYYEQSSQFLQAVSATILRLSRERLGLLERHLPEHVLIAVGPAGRCEFSPFCPLQTLLVCRHENSLGMESLRHYGAIVHEGFEACGLQVDQEITPLNHMWCSSFPLWCQKLSLDLEHAEQDEMIDLLRLTDQAVLAGSRSLFTEFRLHTKMQLSSSPNALENLVSRASLLSNGLGLLGGLRLEKSGPYRGCFPLLDHALQPLTASISAFSLFAKLDSETSPGRVRELMSHGKLSVDMAEELLHAWVDVNELRLMHEQESQHNWLDPSPLHIDLDTLSDEEQESLRKKLEAVGHFQRYLYTTFSSLGR